MKCDKETMLLYAVTDRAWVGKQSLYEQVEAALKGGVTCVQLREKELEEWLQREKVPYLYVYNKIDNYLFVNEFCSSRESKPLFWKE